jgi:anti-sigma B factor antagonist
MNDEPLLLATSSLASTGEGQPHGFRLVATGEIDLDTTPQLTEALDALIADGATLVVLDATNVTFLDSSGLRAIVNAGNRLEQAGGQLLIEGITGAVQRVLEVSGLIERYRA